MLKSIVASLGVALGLAPALARGDAWTDGQVQWEKHGFKHGDWDCHGRCPAGLPSLKKAKAPRASPAESFDGAWRVSSGGTCASAGINQIVISSHRISGPGVSGSVSSGGTVHTVGSVNGLSIIGSGHITGASASGVYRQSDGCSGGWSASKL